jgi:hypothetical protein
MPVKAHPDVIRALAFDELERLWVQVYAPEGSHFDVYSTDGVLLEQVQIDETIGLFDVSSSALLALNINTDLGTFEVYKFSPEQPEGEGKQ